MILSAPAFLCLYFLAFRNAPCLPFEILRLAWQGRCPGKGNGNPLQCSCLQGCLPGSLRQGTRNTRCFPAEKPDKAETWAVLRTPRQLALPPTQRQGPSTSPARAQTFKEPNDILVWALEGSVGAGCGWVADLPQSGRLFLPLSSWLLSLKMLTQTEKLCHSGNMYSNSVKLYRPQACRTHTFFLSLNLTCFRPHPTNVAEI